jgi:hypothetical protein
VESGEGTSGMHLEERGMRTRSSALCRGQRLGGLGVACGLGDARRLDREG